MKKKETIISFIQVRLSLSKKKGGCCALPFLLTNLLFYDNIKKIIMNGNIVMSKIIVNLKEIKSEALPLYKIGKEFDVSFSDVTSFSSFNGFVSSAHTDVITSKEMSKIGEFLCELQNKNSVPRDFFELSILFKDLKESDCAYYAFSYMKDIYRNENIVSCTVEEGDNLFATASQCDDISAIYVVNNSVKTEFVPLYICGLPGKDVHLECYITDGSNINSHLFSTSTKQEDTTVMLPVVPYSIYILKVR